MVPRLASTSTTVTSASPAPAHAAATMARSSRRFGLTKMPGVSTNTICAAPSIAIASTRVRVVCTLGVTIEILEPTRLFSRVDLPALGAPTIAAKPQRVSTTAARPLAAVEGLDDREQRGRRDLLGGALRAPLAGRRRN